MYLQEAIARIGMPLFIQALSNYVMGWIITAMEMLTKV